MGEYIRYKIPGNSLYITVKEEDFALGRKPNQTEYKVKRELDRAEDLLNTRIWKRMGNGIHVSLDSMSLTELIKESERLGTNVHPVLFKDEWLSLFKQKIEDKIK